MCCAFLSAVGSGSVINKRRFVLHDDDTRAPSCGRRRRYKIIIQRMKFFSWILSVVEACWVSRWSGEHTNVTEWLFWPVLIIFLCKCGSWNKCFFFCGCHFSVFMLWWLFYFFVILCKQRRFFGVRMVIFTAIPTSAAASLIRDSFSRLIFFPLATHRIGAWGKKNKIMREQESVSDFEFGMETYWISCQSPRSTRRDRKDPSSKITHDEIKESMNPNLESH